MELLDTMTISIYAKADHLPDKEVDRLCDKSEDTMLNIQSLMENLYGLGGQYHDPELVVKAVQD